MVECLVGARARCERADGLVDYYSPLVNRGLKTRPFLSKRACFDNLLPTWIHPQLLKIELMKDHFVGS